MVKDKYTIKDPKGIHLRPAGEFCTEALKFQSSIQILKENKIANGKSVLSVLGACIRNGDEIELVCEGKDEKEALVKLGEMIQREFNWEN